MLPGFNHNIRHGGVLFHVQTEDKGQKNPVIVTQLFYEGHVVASKKVSYEKFVGALQAQDIVFSMMKEQHKQIMKDLVEGRIRAASAYLTSPPATKSHKETVSLPLKQTGARVLDPLANKSAEKTLDELILDFLEQEKS